MLYALLILVLLALDQAVKFLVRAYIPLGGHVPFLPYVLELTYVRNTGMAFSLLAEHTWLLTVGSILVVAALAAAMWKGLIAHPAGRIIVSVIMAGGVGNLIDRVLFGYVTDMFATLFMDFAVFNVADICITVGVAALAVYVLFFYDKLEKKEAPKNDAEVPEDDAGLSADGQ